MTKEHNMKPIVEIMDKAIEKLNKIKLKNGESFLERWENVIFDAGYTDMEFEYGLVELTNSIVQAERERMLKKLRYLPAWTTLKEVVDILRED